VKRILIVSVDMHVGGIQKSLLELLKALAEQGEYEVSLFCCSLNGAYAKGIPPEIRVISENKYAATSCLSAVACKTFGFKYFFLRAVFSMWSKLFSKTFPAYLLCKLIGRIGEDYDVAISYSQPIGDHAFSNLTNEIVLKCTSAKRKITFVHCDFGAYDGNTRGNRNLYKKFDRIAAVSHSVGKRFAEIMPELAERVYTVYNFCDCNEILRLADIDPVKYTKTAFVTVARLSAEKGLLRCVALFEKLKNEGYEAEWHIIGGGVQKQALIDEIKKRKMEDSIFLEGEQLNPYRYVKNADYFLLPSFHEAAPMVFDEALTLGVPILTTKTLSAVELVESRNIGVVCENDEDSIYGMIREAAENPPKLNNDIKPQRSVCMNQFAEICK